ncbi:hypothetical protein PCE31106_04653 [Pandoraea cepalis]|uniref:Uncharacterized protein n=1 Tax=Pandoraea cepalis TaxID=2508294 RepID=A0A5E4YPN8_9BURK|nr:hypothetical protein PCE31106_04653 [Pandoraea cepalis]
MFLQQFRQGRTLSFVAQFCTFFAIKRKRVLAVVLSPTTFPQSQNRIMNITPKPIPHPPNPLP